MKHAENATLKLSRVLLQEIVPNNIRRHIQNCSVPTTCCASLTHLDFFFCCIAELAIKPCRSFQNTCKTGNQKHKPLSHISKHFRKGGFLLLRTGFIHLIVRICAWVVIHNWILLHLESTIFGLPLLPC